jgi:hypothetical protein
LPLYRAVISIFELTQLAVIAFLTAQQDQIAVPVPPHFASQ